MSELRGRAAGFGRALTIVAFVAVAFALLVGPSSAAPTAAVPATPQAECGPGAKPETDIQGRVPTADYDNGRVKDGYQCNAEQVGHEGESGGFRVYRYVDGAGHECAYYDTTLLVGTQVLLGPNAGVAVLDMTDPAHPVRTTTLSTPAMLSPHESLNLNQKRGLLAAIDGSPATAPGVVDIYDVSGDCRAPVLKWTGPIGGAGHEATFAPDGNTLYTTATAQAFVVALDVTNPSVPVPVWISTDFTFHGMNVSDDGNRLYAADLGSSTRGLTILDVSQMQQRVMNPLVPGREPSHVGRREHPADRHPDHDRRTSVPRRDRRVLARHEHGPADAPVGAARIIDIADETAPVAISEMRLEVNNADNRAGPRRTTRARATRRRAMPGTTARCRSAPTRASSRAASSSPGCGCSTSTTRTTRRRSRTSTRRAKTSSAPRRRPRSRRRCRTCTCAGSRSPASESSQSSPPPSPADTFKSFPQAPFYGNTLTHWAMSAPTFVPSRNEVWYSDGMYGFYAVKLTNNVWSPVVATTDTSTAAPTLPRTGWTAPLLVVAGLLAFAIATFRLTTAARR